MHDRSPVKFRYEPVWDLEEERGGPWETFGQTHDGTGWDTAITY